MADNDCSWHQDIKPQNILVLSDPDHRDRYIFKLADFGLSHFRSLTANQEQVTGTEMLDRDSRGTREYGMSLCSIGTQALTRRKVHRNAIVVLFISTKLLVW